MNESIVATPVVNIANAATNALAINKDDAAKAKKNAFAPAIECFEVKQAGDVVTLTMSKALTLYVHSTKDVLNIERFYCDAVNNASVDASLNESPQEKRNQAIRYAMRNALYQAINRDIAETRATVKTTITTLTNTANLATAKVALMSYAMAMSDVITSGDVECVRTGDADFYAKVLTLDATSRIAGYLATLDAASQAPVATTPATTPATPAAPAASGKPNNRRQNQR